MFFKFCCALFIFVSLTHAQCKKPFPKGFKFGVSTAAYQIEGAWNEDGKGESIWDHICHTNPTFIRNSENGDVACDSYHKTKEDVQLIKSLGVKYYRFSISWPRVLPTGDLNNINKAGIQYYKNLIKELRENDIEPMVTLFHWDLPQSLQDIGGWMNPQMEYLFGNYARLMFETFGKNIKTWVTFNEPRNYCSSSYGTATMPPAVNASGIGDYICTHNVLKAHARAYHIYKDEFRRKFKGRLSISLDFQWLEPATSNDTEEAETARQFQLGWYAHPIILGDYPKVMRERIAYRSEKEGYPVSRLPKFTKKEISYIKGTYDFFALNTYTTFLAHTMPEASFDTPSFKNDMGATLTQDPKWEGSASSWLKVVPWGMRKALKWISYTYKKPEILITENGVSDAGVLEDDIRISYTYKYLSQVMDAINKDKVNVSGYVAWSYMDNFEWRSGYSEKFGFYQVDFNSPNRTRTPKKSVNFFNNLTTSYCLDNEYAK